MTSSNGLKSNLNLSDSFLLAQSDDEFQSIRHRYQKKDVAFIPTMGHLHDGHLALIKKAVEAHFSLVVVSIFVNPLQFGPQEDFLNYPRTLQKDNQLLQQSLKLSPHQRLLLYAPKNKEEIFPEYFSTTISIGPLSRELCGAIRPGHFDGVCTVCFRLFQIVDPTIAYFGQKDYQQVIIIKKMIRDLSLPLTIEVAPTIRHPKGLALSSRHSYLTQEELQQANIIFETLKKLSSYSYQERLQFIKEILTDPSWQYLTVRHYKTLQPATEQDHELIFLAAKKIGSVRLIDNLFSYPDLLDKLNTSLLQKGQNA